jgi:hypothetical protein
MENAKEVNKHETGREQTDQNKPKYWDTIGTQNGMLPFFQPTVDMKRKGFRVQFISPTPRKETPNQFDKSATDCWFDIISLGKKGDLKNSDMPVIPEKMTWTICQISLLTELKKHSPLTNKIFEVKLVKVEDEWKQKHPNYKGKERYEVIYLETKDPIIPASVSKKAEITAVEIEEISD